MELNVGSYAVYNPAALFEQHEDDEQETKVYADSSSREHSDVAGPEMEIITSNTINCPAYYKSELHDASGSYTV